MGQIISQFIADYGELLVEGVRDTIIMTAVATLLAYVIGLPVGVLLITSAKKGIRPNATLNTVLGWIVNIVRSVPFIILLVAIIPLTRLIVGTSLGVPGAIVPLVITAAPFVARVVEQSLAEVDGSLVEAAQSFGSQQSADRVQSAAVRKPAVAGARRSTDVDHPVRLLRHGRHRRRRRFGRYRHPLRLPALPVRRDDRGRDPVRHPRANRADYRRRDIQPHRPSRALNRRFHAPIYKNRVRIIAFGSDSCMRRHCYVLRLLVEFNNSIYDITCFCSAFPRLDGR